MAQFGVGAAQDECGCHGVARGNTLPVTKAVTGVTLPGSQERRVSSRDVARLDQAGREGSRDRDRSREDLVQEQIAGWGPMVHCILGPSSRWASWGGGLIGLEPQQIEPWICNHIYTVARLVN